MTELSVPPEAGIDALCHDRAARPPLRAVPDLDDLLRTPPDTAMPWVEAADTPGGSQAGVAADPPAPAGPATDRSPAPEGAAAAQARVLGAVLIVTGVAMLVSLAVGYWHVAMTGH